MQHWSEACHFQKYTQGQLILIHLLKAAQSQREIKFLWWMLLKFSKFTLIRGIHLPCSLWTLLLCNPPCKNIKEIRFTRSLIKGTAILRLLLTLLAHILKRKLPEYHKSAYPLHQFWKTIRFYLSKSTIKILQSTRWEFRLSCEREIFSSYQK